MTKKYTRLLGLNSQSRIILGAICLLFPVNLEAATFCKCKPTGEVKDEYNKALSVFSGKVKDIKWKGGNYDHVIFEVGEILKGEEKEELKIMTERPSMVERFFRRSVSCGYMFEEGEEYLVYSYREKRSPAKVSNCGRTKKLVGAEQEINALKDIKSAEKQ